MLSHHRHGSQRRGGFSIGNKVVDARDSNVTDSLEHSISQWPQPAFIGQLFSRDHFRSAREAFVPRGVDVG